MNKIVTVLILVVAVNQVYCQFGPRKLLESSNIGITEVITADINNDGFNDIIVAQKYVYDKVSFYLNLGNETFGNNQLIKSGIENPLSLTSGDYNDDGWVDIVSASTSSGSVSDTLFLFSNNTDNSFTTTVISTEENVVDNIVKLKSADIDNDNDIDIIAISDGNLMVYYNDGTGVFAKTTINSGITTEYYELAVDDIDNDGFDDIVVGGIKTLVYKNDNGVFNFDTLRSNSISNIGLVLLVELNDYDGDGDNDILISGNNSTDLRWYSNDGTGFFSLSQIFQTNISHCKSLSSGDFNLDGKLDVFTGFPQSGKVVWYENLGGGNFGAENIIFTGNIPYTTIFRSADLNQDSSADIIWAQELSFHINNTIVGVVENVSHDSLRVYPNPSSSSISINSLVVGKLSILKPSGQVVNENMKICKGKNMIRLHLKTGLYVLVIETTTKTYIRKLIIK
jgi:hypothetical protein